MFVYYIEMIEVFKVLLIDLFKFDVVIVISVYWEDIEVCVIIYLEFFLIYDYYGFFKEVYFFEYLVKGEVVFVIILLECLVG